jgi:hypothetical protein
MIAIEDIKACNMQHGVIAVSAITAMTQRETSAWLGILAPATSASFFGRTRTNFLYKYSLGICRVVGAKASRTVLIHCSKIVGFLLQHEARIDVG